MNTPLPLEQTSLPMIRALGLIALVSGVLIVVAYEQTAPRIERNRQQAIDAAVFALLPGAQTRRDFVLATNTLRAATVADQGDRLYAGYDSDGQLRGLVLPGAAAGYQGVVSLLYSYDIACACVTGMRVLQSLETPGLGDRIGSDAAFLQNFHQLDARLDAAGNRPAHAIVTVRHGRRQQAWEIDAIAGATISSRAVGKAIARSTEHWLPAVHAQISLLQGAAHEH